MKMVCAYCGGEAEKIPTRWKHKDWSTVPDKGENRFHARGCEIMNYSIVNSN